MVWNWPVGPPHQPRGTCSLHQMKPGRSWRRTHWNFERTERELHRAFPSMVPMVLGKFNLEENISDIMQFFYCIRLLHHLYPILADDGFTEHDGELWYGVVENTEWVSQIITTVAGCQEAESHCHLEFSLEPLMEDVVMTEETGENGHWTWKYYWKHDSSVWTFYSKWIMFTFVFW